MRQLLLTLFWMGKASAVLVWVSGGPVWLGVFLFCAPGLVVVYHLFMPGTEGLGPVQTRFATSRREVWLTIDDGPDESDTPRNLELLARYNAKATFFVIGERAERHPELIQAVVLAGHEIGHHTYSHPAKSLWCASRARLKRELDLGLAALARCGVRPRWFRAPVGIKHVWLEPELQRRGLEHVGWTIRSWDSVEADPAVVARRVRERVRPGSIVLLHEGSRLQPEVRMGALEAVLQVLSEEGYTCVLPHAASPEAAVWTAPAVETEVRVAG